MWLVHAEIYLLLDTEWAAHKLWVVPINRSLILLPAIASVLFACGDDRAPNPEPPAPRQVGVVATRSAAEITGWPRGLGRAFVVRLAAAGDPYRLVVPELGDRRFADSALLVKVGDSIPVVLLGRRGRVGEALARVADREVGTGACVTWPAAEIEGVTYPRRVRAAAWQVAMERDSVTPIMAHSLAGMNAADSARLTNAIHSVIADVPAVADTTLRGIPFAIRRAYSLAAGNLSIVVAELVRTSSSEAAPREQRLFVVGERSADAQTYRNVYSQAATGHADSTASTELLAAVISSEAARPVLLLGVEERGAMRMHLLQRFGRMQWRSSWNSAVGFC